VNAAHTESKEAQEILFKSSAEATAKEIRRVKRGRRCGGKGGEYRLPSILATLSIIKLY